MRFYSLILITSLFVACGNNTEEKTSVNTESKIVKDTVPAVNPYKNANIEVKVFDNAAKGGGAAGFGYDIMIDGKIYIHQPNIPAVPGNEGFLTEEKARKGGELVAYKIRNNIMPPSVSVEELDSIGVLK